MKRPNISFLVSIITTTALIVATSCRSRDLNDSVVLDGPGSSSTEQGTCSDNNIRFLFDVGAKAASPSIPLFDAATGTKENTKLPTCARVCKRDVVGGRVFIDDLNQFVGFIDTKFFKTTRPAACQLGLSHREIKTHYEFDALSNDEPGLILKDLIVKIFIDARNPNARDVFFINSNFTENGTIPSAAKFHKQFAQRVLNIPEDSNFSDVTYFTNNKRYFALKMLKHHIKGRATPVYGVHAFNEDVINEKTIVDAMRIIKKGFVVPGAQLAFVPESEKQTTNTVKNELKELGVEVISIDTIIGSRDYIPMNAGEAFGVLRVFPASNDDLGPSDIPVFRELPLDLTVVAGTITKALQDSMSHVNLKSKERKTPNMVLRGAEMSHPLLAKFNNKPVKLTVSLGGFSIEPVEMSVVIAKLKEKMNRPMQKLGLVPEQNFTRYRDMCANKPADCLVLNRKFGTKAANLGYLNSPTILGRTENPGSVSAKLGYNIVPDGFGVPMQLYIDFLNLPANAELKKTISKFVADEQGGLLSPKLRDEGISKIQGMFLKAKFPDGFLKKIGDSLEIIKVAAAKTSKEVPKKFKFRSSANAEDADNFNGAGLYDSFNGNTEKEDNPDGSCEFKTDPETPTKREMKPKTVACSIKGVYASLWNRRAVDERSFARIDQSTVAMGMSVVPEYDFEDEVAANGVVVTRAVNAVDVFGYSMLSQKDNNLATNPDPGTRAESAFVVFTSQVNPNFARAITQFAQPKADGAVLKEPVLSPKDLSTLIKAIMHAEEVYCRIKPGYFDDCNSVTFSRRKTSALDLEFKLLASGQFVIKQIREFHGQ